MVENVEVKLVNWELINLTILCFVLAGLNCFIYRYLSDWNIAWFSRYFMYFCLIAGVISVIWLILTGFRTTDSEETYNPGIGSVKDIPKEVLYRYHQPIVSDHAEGFYSPIDNHRLSSEELDFFDKNGRWW